ncbi:MAG: NAD(P)-dependent oxidoreductase [Candidatus Nanopelagicales bacterium]|nr:NAD(P)-dependent oxidoreductase [Candidatus Nanopelagicales bacterium]
MRLLLTGTGGTVAPRLAARAVAAGHEVIAWDRAEVPPDDLAACSRFVEHVQPDGIAHLAFGAEAWAGMLARTAAERAAPLVFTSTAMVFAKRPDGPYRPSDPTTADTEYGQYKVRCEQAVRAANAQAMVVRLAYQVDLDGRGNNLVAHLDAAHGRGEAISASTRWIPALAFLDDTAAGLLSFLTDPEPGTHHLDGNAEAAWSYERVVRALAAALGREWRIEATQDPVHDQRLLESRRVRPIDQRLG